jgi:hypothetical protein
MIPKNGLSTNANTTTFKSRLRDYNFPRESEKAEIASGFSEQIHYIDYDTLLPINTLFRNQDVVYVPGLPDIISFPMLPCRYQFLLY